MASINALCTFTEPGDESPVTRSKHPIRNAIRTMFALHFRSAGNQIICNYIM